MSKLYNYEAHSPSNFGSIAIELNAINKNWFSNLLGVTITFVHPFTEIPSKETLNNARQQNSLLKAFDADVNNFV